MLLDSNGLEIGAFKPLLAEILGNSRNETGGNVIAEAQAHPRSKILLRDWIYCLIRASSTMLHKQFIRRMGQKVDGEDGFITTIEEAFPDDNEKYKALTPPLTSEIVEDSVIEALSRAEEIALEYKRKRINDPVLTLALLENADQKLVDLLAAWLGDEEKYLAFINRLKKASRGSIPTGGILDGEGNLRLVDFRGSGRKLIDRLFEDAASLGAKKISTRYLLYTLLGDEGSLLSRSLTIMGMDVKRDLHALLSRELSNPGAKRNDDLRMNDEYLLKSVLRIFEKAKKFSLARDGSGILEHDISLAFVHSQKRELQRLFAGKRSVDLATMYDLMEDTEPDTGDESVSVLKRLPVKEIEEGIRSRILGQDEAIRRIVPWIKRLRFGLPRDERPAGVFLFLGPTGTGKTQMAKELARYVFGDEEMMLFLEMGQFKTKESMNMFIGAPPGYVGYGEGKLTNGLGDKPECVVLFDEIEKAHTQVFDTLLRFADEGIISDPAGPVRNGRKCLIVMTTNAGQTWLQDELKRNPAIAEDDDTLSDQLFEAAMDELKELKFRPEFLGRVDERITFLPLSEKTCTGIVDLVMGREIKKIRELKNIEITVDDSARALLGKFAFKRSMEEGARGVPRTINEHVVTPLIDRVSDLEADLTGNKQIKITATAVGLDRIELEVEV